jgi:hypothetical protein
MTGIPNSRPQLVIERRWIPTAARSVANQLLAMLMITVGAGELAMLRSIGQARKSS